MADRVSKVDIRKSRFKRDIDRDEVRRQRETHVVDIRKQKREEHLMKKRREKMGAGGSSFGTGDELGSYSVSESNIPGQMRAKFDEKLPHMVSGVFSNNIEDNIKASRDFRQLLSIERNPPIDEVIRLQVVPRFVEFLGRDTHPQLQFEAAWALTNIVSGTSAHTEVVIQQGAVPTFIHLLNSPNVDVREQAVWALGNIAGDSALCRDHVLQQGALKPLLKSLTADSKLTMLRNATWTLSNLCRGKPAPVFDLVKPALAVAKDLIFFEDDEVLTDVCWALSYLSDGSSEKIKAVVDSGVVKRVTELLMHDNISVKTPALRTIGNIVTGDDQQTQHVIDVSALPCLFYLLKSPVKAIRKEACWTISNVTAGNKAQIGAVIEANIIPLLVHIIANADFDVRKEAAWAISNATTSGSPEQIKFLVSQGVIKPLCGLLTVHDPRIISIALEALENILTVGQNDHQALGSSNNEYVYLIESVGGLDEIESLQQHANQDVYAKAVKILETFFIIEADEEIEGMNVFPLQ